MCTSQKDIQNSEDKWGKKKQLSGYKQCHTYKNQSLEVSKYMQSHSQTWAGGLRTQSLAILEAKPPPLLMLHLSETFKVEEKGIFLTTKW